MREGVIKLFLIGLFFLSLIACKVELYSNLEEKEANEIMALLLKHGIECSKRPGKENKWVLFVEKDELANYMFSEELSLLNKYLK